MNMFFHFDVEVKAVDFFRLSMRKTYKSPLGICNIVFTVAAILLTLRFFSVASAWVRPVLILMCMIFPVFQPLSVYFRAGNLASGIPKGLTLDINDDGILVSVGSQSETIEWRRVKALIDNKDMLILAVDGNNGYFLTNRVLKDNREAFKKYVDSKLGKR